MRRVSFAADVCVTTSSSFAALLMKVLIEVLLLLRLSHKRSMVFSSKVKYHRCFIVSELEMTFCKSHNAFKSFAGV